MSKEADAVASDVSSLSLSGKKLPIPGKRNILITSALPYVNNVPHLGNIIGCVLSADVWSRFCRLRGYNVLYVCGTDEYGTATETKALAEGLTPQEICDKYHTIHKEIYDWFQIDFDFFGRTTTEWQTKIAQDIFMKLYDNGRLVENTVEQLYSEALQKFLADRYVIGTCPHCHYDDARGDQCDQCGKLLNPTDLKDPKCQVSGTTPTLRQSQHLFLNLPELQESLEGWVKGCLERGGWTQNSVTVTKGWLKEGLKERCITRDLKWGTPVPLEAFKDKVFYVWFDAPIGYISITANYTDEWKQWWHNPENVEYVQFMGKDNIPFHTVIFPSTLLGTGDPWTLMSRISTTEYLNYEDGKFSKSRNLGVFGNNAKEARIIPDVWRYYLLANRPELQDSVFQWADFASKNNNELLANLGNFVNRALTFTYSKLDAIIPELKTCDLNDEDMDVVKQVNECCTQYVSAMEEIHLKEGLRIAMYIAKIGNKYLQDNAPWTLYKDPATLPRCQAILSLSIHLTHLLAHLFHPYMPGVSEKMLHMLNIHISAPYIYTLDVERDVYALAGRKLNKPEVLFRKIEDEEVATLRARYSGGTVAAEEAAVEARERVEACKKEKKKGIQPDEFPLEVRIGEILEAKEHPTSEKLWITRVQIDEKGTTRQIVAGLRTAYPNAEELVSKRVAVVLNLQSASLQGEISEGMILCAESKDKTVLSTLSAPEDIPVGSLLTPIKVTKKGLCALEIPEEPVDKKTFDKVKLVIEKSTGHFTFSRKGNNYPLVPQCKEEARISPEKEGMGGCKVR